MLPKIQAQTIQQDKNSTLPFSPKNEQSSSQQQMAMQNRQNLNSSNGYNMNLTQNMNSNQNSSQNIQTDDILKRKESNWNPRHHVNADLPHYSTYNDRHSESYKLSQSINTQSGRKRKTLGYKQHQIILNDGNIQNSHDMNQSAIYQDEMMGSSSANFKKKQMLSQQRNRSLTYKRVKDQKFQNNNGSMSTNNQQNQILNVAYNQFGMESLSDAQQMQNQNFKNKRILTLKEKVEELYQQIIGLYEFHNFQHFHREYFDLFIQDMPSKRLYDILVREIKLINDKKSLYQITMKTIRARENCLDKLKDAIFSLSDCYEKKDQQIEESCFDNCCRLLAHLRILTISAVEAISQWRNYFFFIQKYAMGYEKYKKKDIMLIFFWEHMNYMLKIRSDAHFVNHSVMNRYIPFSTKYDPFFVYPNKIKGDCAQFSQFSNKIQESINGCLDLSDHLKQRIQNCEKIIINECIMDRANKKLHPISKELLLIQTPKYLQPNRLNTSDQMISMERQVPQYSNQMQRNVSHEPRTQFEQEQLNGSASLRVDKSYNTLRNNSRQGLQSSRKSMSAKQKIGNQDKYQVYSSQRNGINGFSNNNSTNEFKNQKSHKNFNNQSLSLSDIKQNPEYEFENGGDQYNDQQFNQTFSPQKIAERFPNQNQQPSNLNLDQITPNDVNITPNKNISSDQQYYQNNVPYSLQMSHSPSKSQPTYAFSPNQKGNKQINGSQNQLMEDNAVNQSQSSINNGMVYVNSKEPPNQLKKITSQAQPTEKQKRAYSSNNNQNNSSQKQITTPYQKNRVKTQAGQQAIKGGQYNGKNQQPNKKGPNGDMVKMNVQEIGIAISEYIENKLKEPRQKIYYVKPRSIMERELKVTLKDYFLRIPNILYKLLVHNENQFINKLKDEVNFHLLEIREQQTERIAALSIIHIDRQTISCRKIEIDHFSVIELENFDPILKKLLEYIWNNDSVDEVSFKICCNEQPDELNPFQSIQEILFENHFKWREVETSEEENENQNSEGLNPLDLNNSQAYQQGTASLTTTLKVFYVQRPNSKPKIKLPNLKYVENHALTVKQSVIISKEPLEMDDHMKLMNLQYLDKPGKYVDVTMILISILVQIFTSENLRDLASVKTNKKVKETFNIASQLRAPSSGNNNSQIKNLRESQQNNQDQANEKEEQGIQNDYEKSDIQPMKQSQSMVKDTQKSFNNPNNFLLQSGILKNEEFPSIQGLNKYLTGLNQNVFLLKDAPVFKKNKVNLGFLQHGFHLPNFHQSVLTTIGDKPSYYLRIRITEDLQGLCWKLKSSTIYGEHQLLLIPTEDYNNFMFFLDAREYIAKENPPDLFLFLRKFLESVDDKQQVEGDVWIPQFKKKSLLIKNTDVASIFAEKKIYTNLETSLIFRDQIQGGKMILNDLEQNAFLIRAPFIFGMLHNDLDAIIQNVPFYSFVVDEDDLDFVQDKNSYQRRINTNIHPSLLQNVPANSQLKKMNTQETLK
ncbi:hypothetical protein ABPG74_014754 [Tetrahymena malaccensis]